MLHLIEKYGFLVAWKSIKVGENASSCEAYSDWLQDDGF